MDVWRDITVDEIIFHLSAPLEGTSSDVINGFLLRSLMLSCDCRGPFLLSKVVSGTEVFRSFRLSRLFRFIRARRPHCKSCMLGDGGSYIDSVIGAVLSAVRRCQVYSVADDELGFYRKQLCVAG